MKYIKKIILENFQSHKFTEIELDPYLNVIVGPSDHGKTAIIRGLRWALFNEPSGDFFIREGERECSVTVVFSDNTKVKRYRSKSKNTYYLYNAEGEEKVFEGFGTRVPEEIIEQTSMRKITLDGSQSNLINISEQLEGPFLLSEKNSIKANAIGRLVGVHILDDAIKGTLKDIRNLNLKRKNHEETKDSLEKELAEYDYLDFLVLTKDKLKSIREKIKNTQEKLNRLIRLSKELREIEYEIALLDEYLKKLGSIDEVANIERRLAKNINRYKHIFNRFNRLEAIKKDVSLDQSIIYGLKDINRCQDIAQIIREKLITMTKLESLYKSINKTDEGILNSRKVLDELKEIESINKNIIDAENKYIKIDKLIKIQNKLDSINKSIVIGREYVEKLIHVETLETTENLLVSKYKELRTLLDYNERYKQISRSKLEIEKTLVELNGKIHQLLMRYKVLLTELKVCPLCFSSIDKYKIEEIIKNFQ